VIYASGNRVYCQPLSGAKREEISIKLELGRPIPKPLLLRRVRVLDYANGGFGPKTSLLVEQGRICWVGAESGQRIPEDLDVLEANGRFVIPGLFALHVHSWRITDLFLPYGITSVRDMGGSLALHQALTDRGDASSDPVPRYFYPSESQVPEFMMM